MQSSRTLGITAFIFNVTKIFEGGIINFLYKFSRPSSNSTKNFSFKKASHLYNKLKEENLPT